MVLLLNNFGLNDIPKSANESFCIVLYLKQLIFEAVNLLLVMLICFDYSIKA